MSPAGEAVSNEGNQLYFTSFESAQDTVGWPKYGEMTFSEDVPPDGGGRSIQISGGCIHPHAELEIEGPPWNSYVRIECWGKNLAIGGGLSLSRTDEPNTGISLAVTDSSWTRYVSADSLFCPAGRKLRIEIGAGGFVASAMLVDLLAVRHAR
jgi:hypothetical protein